MSGAMDDRTGCRVGPVTVGEGSPPIPGAWGTFPWVTSPPHPPSSWGGGCSPLLGGVDIPPLLLLLSWGHSWPPGGALSSPS